MALTRKELLAKAQRRYAEHEGVRFQSLTELELTALRSVWSKRIQGMDEKNFDSSVFALNARELLQQTMVDETGEKLFKSTTEDLDAIGSLDSELFASLHEFARKHTGIDRDNAEVDRNEGKSDAATA